MSNKGLIRKFMISMTILGICIVSFWVLFYVFMESQSKKNMIVQAESTTDAILADIQDELLSISDTANNLSHYDRVISMMKTKDTVSFYDQGSICAERSDIIVGNYCSADNVIVFRNDGLYYRLKGNISNTALERIYYIISNQTGKTFTVSYNNMSYIGCVEPVMENSDVLGYVVLLMEQSKMETIFSSFSAMEYLGIVVSSEDIIICSNRDFPFESLDSVLQNSLFYRTKPIGLSDFWLSIYCEYDIFRDLTRYFRVFLPITVACLIVAMALFLKYSNRHILSPMNRIIADTYKVGESCLSYTGEEYFDGLVERINEMMSRIELREKELRDSELRLKENELEKERNLLSLLKKQISAHFTVNTLNAIRALIHKGEKEAAIRICDDLSTLLRYANAGEEYISLLEEFFVLEQYASIMQIRYPNRFRFLIETDDSFSELYIPRMLIQPIVENAILHGVREKQGTVTVSAKVDKEIEIFVSDNGVGMDEDVLGALIQDMKTDSNANGTGLSHVALSNISRRIHMLYGPEYGINIQSKRNEGTTVSVLLPIK